MHCPKCSSASTYRTKPESLKVHCDNCGYSWTVNQPQRPISQMRLYKSKPPLKGTHYIDVWLCPEDKSKFSFALRYGSSFPYKFPDPDFPQDPYLKGKFESAKEAIEAGIHEIY